MRSRSRNSQRSFGWISALIFNILLIISGVVVFLIIQETRNARGAEYEPTSEAITATQDRMGRMFADLIPGHESNRQYWAELIDAEVRQGDITSARGFLLSAPYMLNRQDAAAVSAAATTESTGQHDDRLLTAAKLFLPDDVRARYERAVAPPVMDMTPAAPAEAAETEAEAAPETEEEGLQSEALIEDETSATPEPEFFVLGDARDLAFQSAGWIRGDRTDVFALSISGLGLIARDGLLNELELNSRFFEGASLLKTAIRADRLAPDFERTLRDHLERAMPEDTLRANLEAAFASNSNLLIQTDAIFAAFANSVDQPRLRIFLSDLERLAALTEGRATVDALMLIETISSQSDLKRAELISQAGGDRAIALAKHYGEDALNAATTVMDWSMKLISLIAGFIVLSVLMGLIALSTFTRSFHIPKASPY
ncbi:hypothetical protein [Ponticaulis sp.]|uniref:hypothetical protein n=1 Tax=Ponticaulis sp. TaxID=2020902 RepID=UPI000B714C50|nr:hypothetical protein [Ponticaulis sp.]MAJ09933.1 hypothetical protein [Ponticaulis sp.]RPG18543.1 MAG: hypothetical protein CBC85_002160 [Hyphomonadaceae bacterium TMED125]|tara:strand:+ start:24581 stop:25864 length:1284 start_codon:yes stop_codon:yes gene_type:complete